MCVINQLINHPQIFVWKRKNETLNVPAGFYIVKSDFLLTLLVMTNYHVKTDYYEYIIYIYSII